ncbi:MAG: hypothetical protein K0S33_1741 [Bacteroidetes bacterium]|jgi:hypothetical protein|nr:hypothetical protein [Bacteroidota bacterium]
MPIEIKELVIRTVLEGGSKTSGGSSKAEVEQEVKKQLKKYREEIINHCIEAVNEGIKRQQER